MPAKYEAMKKAFMKQGMKEIKAKEHAARIYNSKHRDHPVTNKKD